LIFPTFPEKNFSFFGRPKQKKKEKLGQFSAQREALPFGTDCGGYFNYGPEKLPHSVPTFPCGGQGLWDILIMTSPSRVFNLPDFP
jgi:hypothetical protein